MPTLHDSSRLQGFSDGVFALSATLLVVTLGEVPSSYEELLASVARFPAFALAFAALVSLWSNHREFFARYPLGDGWTVALNSVLLFIVLLYVYPLKLLSEVVAESLLGAAPAATAEMGLAEIRGLYLIFGAAIVAVFLLLVARPRRAGQPPGMKGSPWVATYRYEAGIDLTEPQPRSEWTRVTGQ